MLEGVKVLSFTHFLQGPSCSQTLGDLGADVVKIESTGGAFERGWAGPGSFVNGVSMFFLLGNRNLRSIAIDLKSEEGKKMIYDLVKTYDVVVENFRPGVMDRLGFSYEKLKEINSRVIYCSCSGYGSSGPYVNKPGQDLLAQSIGGLVDMTGREQPSAAGSSIVDQHGAILAALGIVSAVYEREKTGHGHKIDASLLNAALDLQIEPLAYYMNAKPTVAEKRITTGLGTRIHGSPYGVYKTADGYLTMSLTGFDKLAEVFEPGALDGFTEKDQVERRAQFDRVLSEQMEKKTTKEWTDIFEKNKMWYAPVNTYEDVINDPQVVWNESIMTMEYPKAGKVRVICHPLRYDGEPPRLNRRPPRLGEHTAEVLRECGYSDEQISACKDRGLLYWEE